MSLLSIPKVLASRYETRLGDGQTGLGAEAKEGLYQEEFRLENQPKFT